MPATKRQMNWTGLSMTPSGGSAVTPTGVTNVQYRHQGSVQKFSGDGDRFPTTVVADFADPMFVVTVADINAILGLFGQRGSFTVTHKDAKLAAGGSIQYTAANPAAVYFDGDAGGAHRQFGQGTLNVCFESADGQTNPVSTSLV